MTHSNSPVRVSQPLSLASRYLAVRTATESLAADLSPEDCALQSMPDASPVKWHLAHTSWFFETFILEQTAGYRLFEPAFRALFNSYYISVGDRHPRAERGLLSRPGLEEVLAYRAHVDEHMIHVLGDESSFRRLADLVELGLHHEQQHQELVLTDLKHLFSRNPLNPVFRPRHEGPHQADASPRQWILFPGGLKEVGHDGSGFAFDNEGPSHSVHLEAFELRTHPVTNGEYLEFMEDGGYERAEWWLSDGWDMVQAQRWSAPQYWEKCDGKWRAFTLAGMRDLALDEPVCHVSYYEADAYARWAGARLPNESEWEVAAADAPREGNFLESHRFHPAAAPSSSGAVVQLFGDVWEWTQSAYLPYPGYRPAEGAVGEYNGKFMCNQFVLRGGSCATPRSHIRPTYRNFFPPNARWQFTGIRLARDIADI